VKEDWKACLDEMFTGSADDLTEEELLKYDAKYEEWKMTLSATSDCTSLQTSRQRRSSSKRCLSSRSRSDSDADRTSTPTSPDAKKIRSDAVTLLAMASYDRKQFDIVITCQLS